MKVIKITYMVDNKEWSDGQFEDEPERTLVISPQKLRELIEDELNQGEFLHEICDIQVVRCRQRSILK